MQKIKNLLSHKPTFKTNTVLKALKHRSSQTMLSLQTVQVVQKFPLNLDSVPLAMLTLQSLRQKLDGWIT